MRSEKQGMRRMGCERSAEEDGEEEEDGCSQCQCEQKGD